MPATKVKEIEPGVWEYSDGSIRQSGRIYRKAGPMMQPEISPATARPMLALRREAYLAAAETGAAKGARTSNPLDAWGRIVESRTRVAVDNDGTPGNQAAELVGHALGVLGRSGDQAAAAPALELRLSGAAVEQLALLLRARGDIIEAEAIDVGAA